MNALGVSWKSEEDVMSVVTTEVPPETPLTKRCVFRKIASVFDPLGFVSHFVVVAKILLQQLWTRGYEWDEIILDEIGKEIQSWFEQLQSIVTVRVPRCLREAKKVLTKKILTFVDASQQACGALVYLLCGC